METNPIVPIGSIPRPLVLIEAHKAFLTGQLAQTGLNALCAEAVRDTDRARRGRGICVQIARRRGG